MFPTRVLCLLSVVVFAAPAWAEPLPAGARVRLGTTDLWHGPTVRGLLFAADGKSFYSLSDGDAAVRQWDAATGHELRAFAHKGRLTAFALSRDGRLLATGNTDRTVSLWNTATGEVVASWPRKLAPTSLAFSADNGTLAVLPGNEAESLSLLDAVTGKETHQLKYEGAGRDDIRIRRFRAINANGLIDLDDRMPESGVAFSPAGSHLAVMAGGSITLWDVPTLKKRRRYDVPRERGGESVTMQFAADGQTILAVGSGGVQRFEIDSIEALEPLKDNDGFSSLAVSANGKLIAAAGRSLRLWDGDGKALHTVALEDQVVSAVACSPDGKTAVTGDRDGQLRVWDVATGKERLLPGPRTQFRSLAFVGDGAALVSCDEHLLIQWSADGKEAQRIKLAAEANGDVLLSPDGRTLALRTKDGEVRLLDTAKGEVRAKLEGKDRKNCAFVFSPDGRQLAVMEANRERPVRVYDASGAEVRQLAGHALMSDAFVFLPDGRTLLTSQGNTSLCLWELATGKPRRTLHVGGPSRYQTMDDDLILLGQMRNGPEKYVQSPQGIAVSADGRVLAAAQGVTVCLIDLVTGKRLGRLETSGGSVECVAYSPDGKLLVGGTTDHLLYLWDATTAKEIGTLTGHRAVVRQLAFSADGKTLATAGADQTALVWDVAAAVDAAREANRPAASTRPLEQVWADLGGNDPARADAALRELASRPQAALPLLSKQLHPVAAVDAKKMAQWIADLDDGEFAVRDKAAQEIANVGEQARDALKAVLMSKPSPELKRQATELLKKLNDHVYSAEVVRDLRALEALESINNAEARKLLETMASGAASDPRTQDAKAALERMKRK